MQLIEREQVSENDLQAGLVILYMRNYFRIPVGVSTSPDVPTDVFRRYPPRWSLAGAT